MTVTIKYGSGYSLEYELAGPGRDSVSEFTISTPTVADVVELLRADGVQTYDRGNLRTEVSFTVIRTWDTVSEAQEFALGHGTAIPRRGKIEFESTRGQVYWLLDALIVVAGPITHIGCTTWIRYQIVGGAMQHS